MSYTPEQLRRASKLAQEGFKFPDGATIGALRSMDLKYVPTRELPHIDRAELKKPVKKGGMR